ncbi:putative bifunctional diguanylate cyclase/phosphodiesterase [Roseibium aggregatum]|uniref:putative bifunctional diguanylate cyclase/phosphodiesterase n=1 Tax=Roseibium aggregatum TaxID=187304 RepID=UPI001A8F4DFA|nr:EAL domain-containing protein [Roseibium aggregatum]MBN8179459.1 EAL domain-containing protein [Roseibium aggregatum]
MPGTHGAVSKLIKVLSTWLPSLRTRFVLLVAGLFLALSVVMIMVASYLDLRDEEQRVVSDARAIGATVSRLAVPHLTNHHYLILEQELESIAGSGVVDLAQVHDPARAVTIDSDPDTSYFDEMDQHPLITLSLQTGLDQIRQTGDRIEIALPVRETADSPVLGVALVSVKRLQANGMLFAIWGRNIVITLVLLIFCIPVTFHFAENFVRPIKALTQTAHTVSAGNFDAPFPVERTDEIGVLARAYRDMVGTIRNNMARIHELAYVDPVTRLPNRESFRQHFNSNMQLPDDTPVRMAVLFIDLDRFKRVNDSYGHDHGDALLKEVAARLQRLLNTSDKVAAGKTAFPPLVARLGGDEFAIVLPAEKPMSNVYTLADQLVQCVEQPLEINGLTMAVGASIGVSTYPDDGEDYTAILKNADIAMYAAKRTGGNRACFFNEIERDSRSHERIRLEAELKRALLADEITIAFQPKIDCATLRVVGAEVLARWDHPERGLLAPGCFIDVAEESDLITRLGDRVLELACRQGRVWLDHGQRLPLAVNVSIRQLEKPGFTARVLDILEITGFPAELLQLEVTETVAMGDPERISEAAMPLLEAGITFAIDDFGTGYSSLAHLQRLPFNTFKIDRSFICGLADDHHSRSIVQTILAMAKSLNYEVVAEGVETEEQHVFLAENGCTTAQGFLFARPMPAEHFEAWSKAFLMDGNYPHLAAGAQPKGGSTFAA